jgi:hypothetical protein
MVVGFALVPPKAEAATYPLDGYAWSENIGWIHFKGSTYGVIVDSANGIFSGHAWSENMGWLSFNQSDLSGCPSGTCRAHLDTQSGAVTGWAKWLITGEWVHLSGPNYGVTYSVQSNKFSGYSFGDTYTGLMKWSNNNPLYEVVSQGPIVAPPEAPTNLIIDTANPTGKPVTKTTIDLKWTDNASGETGFIVERKIGEGGTYGVINTTVPNNNVYDDTGLAGGTLYYYRVKATNSGGDSIYSNPVSTTTLPYTATLNVNVEPNNATWTINPGNIQGTGDQAITVNPSGTGTTYTVTGGSPPSGYDPNPAITNTTTGGAQTMFTLFNDGTAGVTITYQRSFNYTLSNSSLTYNPIVVGQNTEYSSVTINRALTGDSGPAQNVTLSISNVPAGVSYEFVPSSQSIPANGSSLQINFTIPGGTAPANQTVTVTGSPLGKTTTFNMEIQASPEISVVCSASPSSAQVGQTVTWTATASQGTPPYVSYSWQGTNVPTEPAPNTPSFDITYSTTGSKQARATVFDTKGRNSTCSPGFVNIGVNPNFEEF